MLAKDRVVVSKLWITDYWLWSRLVLYSDCWKSMKNCRDSAFSNSGLEAGLPASLSAADVGKMWCTTEKRFMRHVCCRNPFPPSPFLSDSKHPLYQKLEVPESCSTLHQFWIISSSPSLCCTCRKNQSYAKNWTVAKIELLATVGWKQGCQPFSCRCWQNVMHCRKEIYAYLCDMFV